MRILLLVCFFSLGACVHDSQYKSVEPYYVLHDNSSKVWVIDHIYQSNGNDRAPLSLQYKKLLIFHHTGYCYVHEIKTLGQKRGKRGLFDLNIDQKKLEIQFKNETWSFHIDYIGEKKIGLSPKEGSRFKYKLELVSFPEY